MLKRNDISFFLIKCIVIYLCILMLSSLFGLQEKYANHFRRLNTSCFETFNGKGHVAFSSCSDSKNDTYIDITSYEIMNKARLAGTKKIKYGRMEINSKTIGFLPIVIFLTLALATPMKLFRKLQTIIIGLLLMYGFMLFNIWIILMYSFENTDWLQLVETPYFFTVLISFFRAKILSNTATILIFPVFIWIVVSFKKSDWKKWTTNFQLK